MDSAVFSARVSRIQVYHLNEKKDFHLINNKYEAYMELKEYYKRDMVLLQGESDFAVFSDFTDKHKEFVVKPENLSLAAGVYKYSMREGVDKRTELKRIFAEVNEFRQQYDITHPHNYANSHIVLEEIIDQDDALSRIHPASVNGLRCTTVNVNGKVQVLPPWFKIGNNGRFVSGEGLGGLLAGIDVETGIVDTVGFNEKGERFEYHPTTGVKIKGYTIPKWEELLEILQTIGAHFPTIHYIGWDMVLSKKGWCIMEGNFGGEHLWQLIYEKGMKEEFEKLIGWKPETDIWWQNN